LRAIPIVKYQFIHLEKSALRMADNAVKSGPISVAYVEVNTNSITNVGRYKLADGSNVFDIAVIFAANINYNGSKAVLYCNPQVQSILDNSSTQIRPLQAKGIKVVVSLLGNHQGAGISNFTSPAAAADFASQVRNLLYYYGLDGVDMDDEYADYGTNGTPQPNDQSIGWLITALRQAMPYKLITFYNYGPASDSLAKTSPKIGAQLNYAWNSIYDTYNPPDVPGLTKLQLSPAAVDIQGTPSTDAARLAQRTKSEGYGAYMTYNLGGGNNSAYISAFTKPLYGQAAIYTPLSSKGELVHGCLNGNGTIDYSLNGDKATADYYYE
jgi:Glycosyl hydrolases family 18